jgi:hypothetical protein
MRTTAHSSTARRATHQRGQAMTEYLVIGVALALALFIPVPGSQPVESVAQMAAGRIHDFYLYLTFFLSLP